MIGVSMVAAAGTAAAVPVVADPRDDNSHLMEDANCFAYAIAFVDDAQGSSRYHG